MDDMPGRRLLTASLFGAGVSDELTRDQSELARDLQILIEQARSHREMSRDNIIAQVLEAAKRYPEIVNLQSLGGGPWPSVAGERQLSELPLPQNYHACQQGNTDSWPGRPATERYQAMLVQMSPEQRRRTLIIAMRSQCFPPKRSCNTSTTSASLDYANFSGKTTPSSARATSQRPSKATLSAILQGHMS
jgi:hypothetical protein